MPARRELQLFRLQQTITGALWSVRGQQDGIPLSTTDHIRYCRSPDIAAPANGDDGDASESLSGTSMACPHVSGIIAHVKHLHAKLMVSSKHKISSCHDL
uniref:Peptidase S8/S53 domain-containing protein n=1 Tax=Populus trichocarpa TaxID=3694 RepID=A0A2K1R411_POPTR